MRLVFENATIQDAIGKAVKIAPTRGSAFDQANGLLVTVEGGRVNLRATDTLVFYHEIVDAIEVEGEGEWRIPSTLFGAWMAKIKIGSGLRLTLEQDGSFLKGRTQNNRVQFRLSDPVYYPSWEPFAAADMDSISAMGERIGMVEWAANTDPTPPLNSIYLDGTRVMATNRIVLAVAPCLAPQLESPIMVPKSAFAPISAQLSETAVAVEGGHMLLMPDATTQIKVVTYAGQYPPVERIMRRDHPEHFTASRNELIEIIERAMVFGGDSRTPIIQLWLGQEQVAVYMKDEDQNTIGDILDVPGHCQHERCVLEFTPSNILNALRHCPNDQVTFGYDPTKPRTILHVDGGSGYECWIAARSDADAQATNNNN